MLMIFSTLTVSTAAIAAEEGMSDEAMERFLLEAEVVRIEQMLPGSTYPMALELEAHGGVRKAAYKYRSADLRQLEDRADGLPPVDSYLHEVAAYRLDRILGLGMVPVAVVRDIHAEGAVIEWISDAETEKSLNERGERPRGSQQLGPQQAVMNLFDALIANQDRKPSDQLITPGDWKLHLVDHSRAFQITDELPQDFLDRPVSLPRSLLLDLSLLNAESLEETLEGLVSTAQIESLLKRRDRILEKISADREKYGDARVFQD